ncbi:Threonine/homoserine/homoserine lactone efflux protein [Fictibacillus enclensis]|uniref:Threonine transporter RhtB n=1 Tax=Fictibacillus enclensis TaxID=1017270 RepID=A0A0V8JC67_9BACL|nr:LysE family translocator [Fictibacillus enclensis]KSU84529.1 threonine transporter RhtB [Fictibacillus enclensis]SCB81020.1 Threonine/homoserine/homoserine lactone efflux protein [Fictibacillus enclensis]
MEVVSILSFLAAAIVLTIMPGPDNLFVLAQSIAKGKKAGISTALGLCTGLIVHISAVTAGLSAVIYQSAVVFSIIKYAGAAYLLFLAYKSFREKNSQFTLTSADTLNYTALYKRGIIMNLLNPKVSLFFLAFLPQFVNYHSGHVSLQMLTYGILFLLQALLLFTLISIFAEKAGNFIRKNPRVSSKINFIQGSLFTLIGLKIAFSQR